MILRLFQSEGWGFETKKVSSAFDIENVGTPAQGFWDEL